MKRRSSSFVISLIATYDEGGDWSQEAYDLGYKLSRSRDYARIKKIVTSLAEEGYPHVAKRVLYGAEIASKRRGKS